MTTWIITPATAPHRFPTGRTSGADVALVDLEDSVAPHLKSRARRQAQDFFHPTPNVTLGVRINSLTSREAIHDLAALSCYPVKPDLVLIPKTESARDIDIVAAALDTTDYTPTLYALIETPRAVQELSTIITPRLGGLLFGAADYARACGCALTWEPLLYARSRVTACAAQAGIPAIDSPHFALTDHQGLRDEARKARALGFTGKSAVHPRQLPVITAEFRPTPEEITAARAAVAAAQDNTAGIVCVDGHMVGAPLLARARTVLAQADAQPATTKEAP